ncbi:hypothetical protein FACS18949_14790 [Clostridia bacterium]|nr:hypothetical protein FACS189425_04950 [Clostridia bacterium]GHV35946.1 hypothetical protein FACS18949_14790 [Clostridia bacterium]
MSAEKVNPFYPYELQFTVQRRKQMIAEMIGELRKTQGYQQKRIAELLGISPQTYNGYETGRNEPPVEILVRLSYLYNMPLDILVQRDRQHNTNESAMLTVNKIQGELMGVKKALARSPLAENEQIGELIDMISQFTDAFKVVVEEKSK